MVYLSNFDVSPLETFVPKKEAYDLLPGFTCFAKCGKKVHRKGRCSGDIAVYIRNSYIEHFELLTSEFEFGVFLKIKNSLVSHDVIYCAVYVTPERSSAYSYTEESGIALLDDGPHEIAARLICNKLQSSLVLTPSFVCDLFLAVSKGGGISRVLVRGHPVHVDVQNANRNTVFPLLLTTFLLCES